MSKHMKREGLQLGEPLPLPYKVDPPRSISSSGNRIYTESDIKSFGRSQPRSISDSLTLGDSSQKLRKIVVGKLRDGKPQNAMEKLVNEVDKESSQDSFTVETVRRIHEQLKEIESKYDIEAERKLEIKKKLDLIEEELQLLIHCMRENSVFEELDKIRRDNNLNDIHKNISNTNFTSRLINTQRRILPILSNLSLKQIAILLGVLIIFLGSSFIVSDLTYDYCYYFC